MQFAKAPGADEKKNRRGLRFEGAASVTYAPLLLPLASVGTSFESG